MNQAPQSIDYLDAIFASIRSFNQALAVSRKWLDGAEHAESQAWRLALLHEARAAFERTPPLLAMILERLGTLGPVDTLPAPLDRMSENVTAMQADLAAHAERLARLELREVQQASPVGVA